MNFNLLRINKVNRKKYFQFSILTTTTNETFELPLQAGTHNFVVNWGDGKPNSTITAYDDADRIHTYAVPGTYIISMQGICTAFGFGHYDGGIVIASDATKVRKILDIVDMQFSTFNFAGCSNLTTVLGDASRLKYLSAVGWLFYNCSSLTAIPVGIFDGNTGNIDAQEAFEGCTSITSIPANLFRFHPNMNFQNVFKFCSGITAIPAGLFDYNVAATGMNAIFVGCSGITSIPAGLFDNCVAAADVNWIFADTGITSIPANLFKYNTAITNFSNAFYRCNSLQLNRNVFYADGEQATRFLNKSVNFTDCFRRVSFAGVQGEAPDLWNCNFGTGTPTKTRCFGGAGNSLTSLSNYGDIPADWKS